MLGETVTRYRSGAPTGADDEQGNPIYGPDVTATIPIKRFAPQVPDETAEAFGSQVIEAGTIYGFRGTDLRASDRVLIRGDMWQVHGEPADWKSYSSYAPDGCVILVKRVS